MEEVQIEKPAEVVQEKTSWYKANPKVSMLSVFAALLLLFFVGISFTLNKIKNNDDSKKTTSNNTNNFISNGTIVYGYWTNNSSIINAFDLSDGKEATIATLSYNVKHVKIINNHEIIYINKTDQRDYGKELVIRNIDSNSERTVISADNGFGIDDYVISPNGQYAAVWMVGNSSSSVQFAGSPSRVYTVNVSNNEKHPIYDESSANGQTVHYPIAITDKGELFTDRFLPNSGAGWGYGMSVSDFSGNEKKDIDSMKNGTYSTQPAVSPDGTTLALAGYDGIDGTINIGGFRKALTVPNTVETLNLTNLARTKIETGLKNSLYSLVNWDQITGKLIFKSVQKEGIHTISSTYSVNPTIGSITKLSDIGDLNFYAFLDGETYLLGQKFLDDSGIGNLGAKYSQGINKFYIKKTNATQVSLPINKAPVQLIGVARSAYFPVVDTKGSVISASVQQLQLQTFEIKPTLAPRRTTQQSDPPPSTPSGPDLPMPKCRSLGYPQCNQQNGTSYPESKDLGDLNDPAFSDCVWKMQAEGEGNSSCLDSPLYLYGENGTKVNVSIDTHASNSNVSLVNNSFNATLNDGKIKVGSNLVDSISFDYESRVRKLLPPTSGFVSKKESVASEVEKIASKFELNSRETQDLLNFAKTISSPFVFVSFYDQDTSHNILPIYFDPKPDNYRNIVFYFKKLERMPDKLPMKPEIIPIVRSGFTAVEISYIVR